MGTRAGSKPQAVKDHKEITEVKMDEENALPPPPGVIFSCELEIKERDGDE